MLNGSCGSVPMYGSSLAASSADNDDVQPWEFGPKMEVIDPGSGERFLRIMVDPKDCVNCSARGMSEADHHAKCVKPGPNQLGFRLRFCTPDRFVDPGMGAGRVTTTNQRDNTTYNLTKRGGALDSSQGTLSGATASAFRDGAVGGLSDATWFQSKVKLSPVGDL